MGLGKKSEMESCGQAQINYFFMLRAFTVAGLVAMASAATDLGDVKILCDLYLSTKGPEWTDGRGWTTCEEEKTSDPCGALTSWNGVDCATTVGGPQTTRVTKLDLDNNNLRGMLPESLINLTKLTFFDVGPNKLTFPEKLPFDPDQLTRWCDISDNNKWCISESAAEAASTTGPAFCRSNPDSMRCLSKLYTMKGTGGFNDGCGDLTTTGGWTPGGCLNCTSHFGALPTALAKDGCDAATSEKKFWGTCCFNHVVECGSQPGTFSSPGDIQCSLCPAGKTSTKGPAPGSVAKPGEAGSGLGVAGSCTDCAAGKYAEAGKSPGSKSCRLCMAGQFGSKLASTDGAAGTCTDCDANTFSSSNGSDACAACADGSASAGGWQMCCTKAGGSAGGSGEEYLKQTGTCSQCAPGTTAAPLAADGCKPCPAGTYSTSLVGGGSKAALTECQKCAIGYGSVAGATSCTIDSWLVLIIMLASLVFAACLINCYCRAFAVAPQHGQTRPGAAYSDDGDGGRDGNYMSLPDTERSAGGGGGGGGGAFIGSASGPYSGGGGGAFIGSTSGPYSGGGGGAFIGSASGPYKPPTASGASGGAEPAYVKVMVNSKKRGSLEVGESLSMSRDEARQVMDSEFNPTDEGQANLLATLDAPQDDGPPPANVATDVEGQPLE